MEDFVKAPVFKVGDKVLVRKLSPYAKEQWRDGIVVKHLSAVTYLVNVDESPKAKDTQPVTEDVPPELPEVLRRGSRLSDIVEEREVYNNSIEQNIINDQIVPPQITTPSTSSIREFNGSDIIAKHLARLEEENSSNVNMQRMMELMIEENRRRDAMMERMFAQLSNGFQNGGNSRTAPSTSGSQEPSSFHIMPDLSKSIKFYNGECGGIRGERRSNVKKTTEAHVVQESVEVEGNTARMALVSPYTVKFEYNVTDENDTLYPGLKAEHNHPVNEENVKALKCVQEMKQRAKDT
ncbi:hypothetical protein RN001_012196 [Aquatica leii]|uniref:Uncharacterized protein n=1 Tax=Aquatica leii TaxID=1421715 RepID=A0AAN7SF17_9COLE|nr:hypothetical protein RN001_012196 [Aquatica leii]